MTTADDTAALWLRRYHPTDADAVRLVCFPHAGGSASFYHPVSARFAPVADVISLQYPGRQDRRKEPCVEDLGRLADLVAERLLALDDRPSVFFGHSMGAALAFETAWRLEQKGAGPRTVIASGRRAPSTTRAEEVHLRDDDGIVAEMKRLNGTAAGVLGDEEILRMALPALRGDYRAIETYSCPPDRRVRCGVTVLTGDGDPLTTAEEAERWRDHTEGPFRLRVFTGGHFFLTQHLTAVNGEIAAALAPLGAAPVS
ncbi:thioesterase II family protein [Streptomyces pactum]|uniref:Thioesterase n=1 Tax=Streptomyces pactum TaxID=68249 RepID=A0A1S6JL24_9ACTN|nr:alpha/beta fold hydrolase [Streptomyces pactum]AQS72411.1 thioesterase [Streptomyces pactum]